MFIEFRVNGATVLINLRKVVVIELDAAVLTLWTDGSASGLEYYFDTEEEAQAAFQVFMEVLEHGTE